MSCNSDYNESERGPDRNEPSTSNSTHTTYSMLSCDSTTSLSSLIPVHNSTTKTSTPESHTILELTPDLQIHCMEYLHPRDILSFSCCNKASRLLIHGTGTTTIHHKKIHTAQKENITNHEFSEMLWLHLWNRDYAFIFHSWNIAQDALKESFSNIISQIKMSKKQRQQQQFDNGTILFELLPPKILLSTIPSSVFPTKLMSKDEFISYVNNISYQQQLTSQYLPICATMQEFYLLFTQTWLNYTIAGKSTFTSCYTGIHGHIFNITNFLHDHPGAPETLLLQGGGRDSTIFFESVGHSLSARKIATRKLVEIVDLSCCSGYGDVGLHDEHLSMEGSSDISNNEKNNSHINGHGSKKKNKKRVNRGSKKKHWPLSGLSMTLPDELSLIPKHRSRPKRTMGTLHRIKQRLNEGEKKARIKVKTIMKQMKDDMIGKVNLYFDPFDGRWHGWYLNTDFEAIFIHDLDQ